MKLSGRTSLGQLSQHCHTFTKIPVCFLVGCELLTVTLQAALGLQNGPNGNWQLKEEKTTLLMVSIKCAQSLAKLNWSPRQAGKGVILISVPKLPWAPLAAEA